MGDYRQGFIDGNKEAKNELNKVLELFQDDSIYTGRIVKFEIKNRIKQLSKEIGRKK